MEQLTRFVDVRFPMVTDSAVIQIEEKIRVFVSEDETDIQTGIFCFVIGHPVTRVMRVDQAT